MTILQRAATVAVMTFSLAGLLGHSTPGLASDLARTAISAATPDPMNPAALPIVPAVAQTSTIQPLAAEPAAIRPAVAERPDYDSLSAAVAAQENGDDSDAARCLAGAIYFESKGEPLAGQLAVANVIINRSKSGRFPEDVCGVVKQRGQFSFVRGGAIPTINPASRQYRTAIAIARVALAAAWDSPAPSALYFNTPNRRPGARLTRIAMIGNHVFYR